MSDDVYMLVDDDGSPLGMVDMDRIETAGVRLAFEMAAACADVDAVDQVVSDTITRVGVDEFGYVAGSALAILVKQILAPTLVVTDRMGLDLRTMLRNIANGENSGGE
ncbi:hypothetical protein [Lentzea nigeriaca]|uniref:hypothetical protein n=1 Tax=Lentzea nigeriaca TaxID=1128665 RepID=UPI001957CAEB|nr:hypothetical protein [Lentzea nigeriaca]MBM7860421.1 hypothetical protein [Lentzea nigeriaca]